MEMLRCGKGGAGVEGVVYGVGDVDVVFGGIGGMDGDGPDVDGVEVVGLGDGDIVVGVKVVGFEGGAIVVGVKVVGLEDGAIVIGASEDAAPKEVASSEGASRVVERGQGRPAMDASRLFFIDIDMMLGINMGKTNGCSNAGRSVAGHVSKRSRHDGVRNGKTRSKVVNQRMSRNDQSSRTNPRSLQGASKITVDAQEPASLSFFIR